MPVLLLLPFCLPLAHRPTLNSCHVLLFVATSCSSFHVLPLPFYLCLWFSLPYDLRSPDYSFILWYSVNWISSFMLLECFLNVSRIQCQHLILAPWFIEICLFLSTNSAFTDFCHTIIECWLVCTNILNMPAGLEQGPVLVSLLQSHKDLVWNPDPQISFISSCSKSSAPHLVLQVWCSHRATNFNMRVCKMYTLEKSPNLSVSCVTFYVRIKHLTHPCSSNCNGQLWPG